MWRLSSYCDHISVGFGQNLRNIYVFIFMDVILQTLLNWNIMLQYEKEEAHRHPR